MKNGITTISGWISVLTGLLQQLIVLGVVIGILFGDRFGVIAGIGNIYACEALHRAGISPNRKAKNI